jgi:virginiamycin B lyase
MRSVSPDNRRRSGPVRYRFRPQLHALEDRCLLSTLWNNFALPDANGHVSALTSGPDGNIWFTDSAAHRIGRITPAGTITEFALSSSSSPAHITAGHDGSLWFTDNALDEIARITVQGVVTEFPLSAARPAALVDGVPEEIVTAQDDSLWFSLANPGELGRLSTSGVFTDFQLGNVQPDNLTAGSDGNIWYIDRLHNQIGRVTPAGAITSFRLPSAGAGTASPLALTLGPDGNLWFSEGSTGGQIGRLTFTGTFTMFDLAAGHAAFGIQAGPDSSLWFTESGRIGRFNPFTGIMTEFPLPVDPPATFTAGADGNLWFAQGSMVAQLDHSNLPPGNIVSISLIGTLPSVNVSVTYVLTGAAATSFFGTIVIDWGDARTSAETNSFSPSSALQVQVDHTYVASGPYTILLSINQSNGVLIKAMFKPAPGASNAPGVVPASGLPDDSVQVGFGGGFGGFDSNGQVPWKSLTNHGSPDTQGSPAGTVAFPYATQALEGFTSLPSSRGFVLLISLQYSVGTAQPGNTPGYSSGSSQPEAADAVVPVSTRVGQANISGASGPDEGPAAPSRLAASYGSRRQIDPPSGSERAASSVLPQALQTVQTALDEPGPALVGESLRGAVPSEQDLLSIAWDIVAADAHPRREGAPSWAWLEKVLIGTALGAVATESVLWGLDLSRRRSDVRRSQFKDGAYLLATSR